MNRKSHFAMGATETAAYLAMIGYDPITAACGGALGGAMAHIPDYDHRSRGLWNDYRDWLHCIEPWMVVVLPLLLSPYPWAHFLGHVISISIFSHAFADSFTTAGVPVSIILRYATGKTWGLKLFTLYVKDRWTGKMRQCWQAYAISFAFSLAALAIFVGTIMEGGVVVW